MDDQKILLQIMNEKIDRLIVVNEKQNDKLVDHDIKLAEYNASLNEHMRRTELLEISMEEHKAQSQKNHDSIQGKIKPILEQENFKKTLKRYILAVGAIAGSLYAIIRLTNLF